MRKLLALALVAATACGGTQSFKDQARDALPDQNAVRMGNPGEAQGSTQTSLAAAAEVSAVDRDAKGRTQLNLPDASPWYKATAAFVFSINAGTASILRIVEAV